jgi:adenosyl cobinamide kinase/adenosyl cobinamide phosphate guanylyltransferase
MTTEIPKEQWKEFFDNLSNDLDGWETNVEVVSNEVGSHVLFQGLPFHA